MKLGVTYTPIEVRDRRRRRRRLSWEEDDELNNQIKKWE